MRVKAKLIRDYIAAVSKLDNEPCLKMSKDGLTTIAVDPAHVAIVKARLPISDGLAITDELSVCVDAEKITKYLKNFKADEMLNFEFPDGKIIIKSGGLKFTMAQIAAKDSPKVPNLTLPASGTIKTTDLKAVLNSKITDNIRFNITGGKFFITATSDVDEIEVSAPSSIEGTFKASYPGDYVTNAVSGDELLIEFGNDMPCRLYPNNPDLEIMFLVAPRIEQD